MRYSTQLTLVVMAILGLLVPQRSPAQSATPSADLILEVTTTYFSLVESRNPYLHLRVFSDGVGHQADSGTPVSRQPVFRRVRMALGFKDGHPTYTTTYSAPDGEEVSFSKNHFKSADDAKKEKDELVKMAIEVNKTEHTTGKNGEITSERSVLTLPVKGETKTLTVIVLTRDSDFWEISSYSAQDAFAFEKQLKLDIHGANENP